MKPENELGLEVLYYNDIAYLDGGAGLCDFAGEEGAWDSPVPAPSA